MTLRGYAIASLLGMTIVMSTRHADSGGDVAIADTPTPTATATPTPFPALNNGLGGAPGGFMLPTPPPPSPPTPLPTPFPKRVLVVSIQGQDLSNVGSVDPRILYAFRSFSVILAKYGITSYSYKSIGSAADASAYCSSAYASAPILVVAMNMPAAAQNAYTSGFHFQVEFYGSQYVCVGTSELTNFNEPTIEGSWDHYYYPNPFQGAYAGLALLTSPWINKYKLYLTVPTTIIGSFEHDTDVADGTVYCAVAASLSTFLKEPNDALVLPSPLPTNAPNIASLTPGANNLQCHQ